MEKRLEEQRREEQLLHKELVERQTHALRRAQSMKELKDQETITVRVASPVLPVHVSVWDVSSPTYTPVHLITGQKRFWNLF